MCLKNKVVFGILTLLVYTFFLTSCCMTNVSNYNNSDVREYSAEGSKSSTNKIMNDNEFSDTVTSQYIQNEVTIQESDNEKNRDCNIVNIYDNIAEIIIQKPLDLKEIKDISAVDTVYLYFTLDGNGALSDCLQELSCFERLETLYIDFSDMKLDGSVFKIGNIKNLFIENATVFFSQTSEELFTDLDRFSAYSVTFDFENNLPVLISASDIDFRNCLFYGDKPLDFIDRNSVLDLKITDCDFSQFDFSHYTNVKRLQVYSEDSENNIDIYQIAEMPSLEYLSYAWWLFDENAISVLNEINPLCIAKAVYGI